MHRRIVRELLGMALVFLVACSSDESTQDVDTVTSLGSPTAEACDFVTTPFPSYEQVLDCYRSVPWCRDQNDSLLCDVDNQADAFEQAVESFSTVKGFVNEQADYRNKLQAIRNATFDNDYEQYLAFQDLVKGIRNGHWFYGGPVCYSLEILGTIPLDFGSMKAKLSSFREPEQIIYLEAPLNQPTPYDVPPDEAVGPGLADSYLAQRGIDLFQYEGRRVVSINGVDAIDYFRDWAENVDQVDGDAGNGLMEILDFSTWSVRYDSFSVFPEEPVVEIVVANRFGHQETLELPWLFIPAADVGLIPGTPTASNTEFEQRCFTPLSLDSFLLDGTGDVASMKNATSGREVLERARGTDRAKFLAPEQMARRNRMGRIAKSGPDGRPSGPGGGGDFVEVPASMENKDIVELLPPTNGARVVQYAKDTVAIQLADFEQPWLEEVRFGVEYACQNADRLILDLRDNPGGSGGQTEWLLDYVYPEGLPEERRLVLRDLAASPRLNDLRSAAFAVGEFYDEATLDSAWKVEELPDDPVFGGPRTALQMAVDEDFFPNPPLAPSPGYGNQWIQEARWTVTVPSADSPELVGEVFYDIEVDFDLLFIDVDDGSSFAELDVLTGQSGAFVPFQYDLSPWAGQNIDVVVTFVSDFFTSDQDGFYDSVLPVAFDSVSVTGGGPSEDFDGTTVEQLVDWSFFSGYLPWPCASLHEPGCYVDFSEETPFVDEFWYEPGFPEQRGTDQETLSPLFSDIERDFFPFEQNPCPGKFQGKDFLVVVNGLNASAAYFAAVGLDAVSTSVMLGGYPDREEMFLGQARGGNTRETLGLFFDQDFLAIVAHTLDLPLSPDPLPTQQRDVLFTLEWQGVYKSDLVTQNSVRDPKPVADLQIPFWSNSPETDGAAYRAAVSAVEREAIIEPVCGDPDGYSTCDEYAHCAKEATKQAVDNGVTSAKDAARARVDAVAECLKYTAGATQLAGASSTALH